MATPLRRPRGCLPPLSALPVLALGAALSACGSGPRAGGSPSEAATLPSFKATPPAGAPVAPTNLTGFTPPEVYGRLSPSGEVLVYSSNAKGNFDIWARNLRTGAPIQITDHPAMDTMPVWSPDGEKLVFVSMRDDVKGDLFLWEGDPTEDTDEPAEQLTGRKLGELFPVFSPDGRYVYFAQGPEGRYRIARLDLDAVDDKRDRDDPVAEQPITEWGFSHPAISPDGHRLAMTHFQPGQPAQIALIEIENPEGTPKYGKPRVVTAGPYDKGFPAFSPDGQTLYFTVFHKGAPQATATGDAEGAVFAMPTARLGQLPAEEQMALATQLTADRAVSMLSQAHAAGLVVSGQRAGNFDVMLLPPQGLLPATDSIAAQLALVASYTDPYERAFALKGLARFLPDAQAQAGLYEALELYADAGEFEKAAALGEQLAGVPGGGAFAELGRCRAASAKAEAKKAREAETGDSFEDDDAQAALRRLETAASQVSTPAGKAQCEVQRGEVLLLSGDWQAAAAAFRGVLAQSGDAAVAAQSAAAHNGLGRVLSKMPGGGEVGAEYFLAAFEKWPGERRALDRAATEALRAVAAASPEPALEIETLRFLADRHANKPRFAARAQLRLGELYAASGQYALAAQAMETLLDRYPDAEPYTTQAGFLAGEHAAHLAAELRAQGRYNEASAFYDRALASYARVMKAHPPLNPLHRQAREQTVALSLQRAFQAEQDGDTEKAIGLYRKLLAFEPEAVAALRKTIQYDLNHGVPAPANDAMSEAEVKARRKEIEAKLEENWDTLHDAFEARLKADPSDFGATYGLGYLWTFDPDLRPKSLAKAEDFLRQAADLRPQSPFPHMTLGWVQLMREQYFDKVDAAYVVAALDEYQIAYGLNDRGIDLQTEADLLVSHGNAWAALGNGWTYAYEKYKAREALIDLGAGFTNPEQKAMFYFNSAQAAYMTDHYAEAEERYETARAIVLGRLAVVDPVLAEGYREMDAQIVAHLALVDHFMGDYEGSNRFFQQTIDTYKARGKTRLLSALTRSVAYNLVLMGEYGQASAKLDEARELYGLYGGMKGDESTRIALTPEGSLFFGGFSGESEKHVQTALADLIYRDNHALWYAAQEAERQLDQREKLYKANENADFARALWILKGRVGNSALRAGDRQRFAEELDDIFDRAVELQWDDAAADGEEFTGKPELFEFMATAMTNRAEQMLKDLANRERLPEDALADLAGRLRKMEDWRQRIERSGGGALIADEELRLKYLNATALLFLAHGRSLATADSAAEKGGENGGGKKSGKWGTFSLQGKFDQWMLQASFFSDAAGLLLEAAARTAPEIDPAVTPAPDTVKIFIADRLRWHVETLLNLADVASYFTAPGALDTDRGQGYLDRARSICHVDEALARNAKRAADAEAAKAAAEAAAQAAAVEEAPPEAQAEDNGADEPAPAKAPGEEEMEETPVPVRLDLGHACALVDMELASRKGDADAAAKLIADFPPAHFLGASYRTHSAEIRHRLYGQAEDIAARAGRFDLLLHLADLEDRRLVADELWAFGYASPSRPLQNALDPIRQWANFFQRAWANQTVDPKQDDAHEAAWAAMDKARDPALWADLWDRVDRQSHAVAELLRGGEPTDDATAEALGDDAAILSAVPVGEVVHFFLTRKDGSQLALKHAVARGKLSAIRAAAAFGEQNLDAVRALLPAELSSWFGGERTLYLDLLRLGPEFPADALAASLLPKATPIHLVGRTELNDAYQARNLYVTGGLALASDDLKGSATTRAELDPIVGKLDGWRLPEPEKLEVGRVGGYMQQAGVQLWSVPLRVEEDSVANVRLGLKGTVPGLADYRFPLRLGDRLKTSFVAALGLHTGLRDRDAHVMLTRYLHALGVPTVALAPQGHLGSPAIVPWFAELIRRLGKERAADAFMRAPVPQAAVPYVKGQDVADEDPTGRPMQRFDRVRLFGWVGLSPLDTEGAGVDAEKMAAQGRRAWDLGQYRVAAADFEPALALWKTAGDSESEKVLGVQDLLAQTHALLGDTRSAVLQRLETVEKLEKLGAPPARLFGTWLSVPEWQTAGGRSADALEGLPAIKERLEKALASAGSPADKAVLTGFQAEAFGVEATALEAQGRFAEAVSGYEKAAVLARTALDAGGDPAGQRRRIAKYAAMGARLAREQLSDSARAKRGLAEAVEAMPALDVRAFLDAEATYAAAVKRLAEAESAPDEAAYTQIHTLRDTLAPQRQDAQARAVVLRELAFVKLSRADAAGAAVDAAQATELAAPLLDQSLAHGCRLALGQARLAMGDALEALAVAEAGLRASRTQPGYNARFHAARGRALDRLGRIDEAKAAFNEASALAREAHEDAAYVDAVRGLGELELYAGNLPKAAADFEKAELEGQKSGDKVQLADDRVNSAKVLRLLGRTDEALKLLQTAKKEAGADIWGIQVRVGLELGRVLQARTDEAGALAAYRDALAAEGHLSLPAVRWMLLLGQAQALMAQGQNDAAEASLKEAAAAVELLPARTRRAPGAPRVDFDFKDVYDQLVRLYLGQNKAEAAFDAAERWRARSFIDMNARSAEMFRTGQKAVAAYTQALSALRQAEAEAAEATADERAAARKTADEARSAAEKARLALTGINAQLPAFFAVDAAPFATLKGALPPGTSLLAYHTAEWGAVAFVADAGGLTMTPLKTDARALVLEVRNLRRHLEAFDAVEADAGRLYDTLLGPVADKLQNSVVIVPEGPLNILPFAALHTGKGWAVERWRLSTLPSATHLRTLAPVGVISPRTPTAFNWAGMGPDSEPKPGSKKYFRRLEEWRALRQAWPHLPFTEKEVQAFAESFPGASVLTGRAASRQAFLTGAPKADLLEVATHAVYVPENPMLSYLQFGGSEKADVFPSVAEERVTLYDILGLDLQAAVATLSACETGLTDPEGADGLSGMHRAFLAAGARNVVSSLWRVSDLASGVLMKNFHRNLRAEDPATALRDAQLKVMRTFPHPANWAGFRLDGLSKR